MSMPAQNDLTRNLAKEACLTEVAEAGASAKVGTCCDKDEPHNLLMAEVRTATGADSQRTNAQPAAMQARQGRAATMPRGMATSHSQNHGQKRRAACRVTCQPGPRKTKQKKQTATKGGTRLVPKSALRLGPTSRLQQKYERIKKIVIFRLASTHPCCNHPFGDS